MINLNLIKIISLTRSSKTELQKIVMSLIFSVLQYKFDHI